MSDVILLPLRALVETKRDEIKAIATRHKGKAIAIFGSVARGDETPTSDVDFLVRFEVGSSLFDLADLEAELAEVLGDGCRRRVCKWPQTSRPTDPRRSRVAVI